ncbi:MAG: hypothetical protein QOF21_2765 [Actinomycetota bacterium]|jgi:hypothetical protein
MNTQLAHALISLTRAYARTAEAPTLPLYAVVLRPLEESGTAVKEFPTLARISKRAATTLLNGAEKSGLLTNEDKVARLTDVGVRARDLGEKTLAATEAEWGASIGDAAVASLRDALEAVVAKFELEHPHYVMTYGTADVSAIGGKYPRHGTDWKPVIRSGSDSAAGLPLSALLSQAIMDFTIRYESGFTWALSSTVHALLKFPDDGMLLTDAPSEAGLTGDGKSLLERHLIAEVDDGGGDRKARRATLTMQGKFARGEYSSNVARVEREWRAAHGDAADDALRAALSEVDARLEPGLADHPLITWMGGLREASGTL